MAARGVRVYAVVFEDAASGRKCYLVEKFLRALDFDPGLSKTCLFITHIFDFDIPLLIWIISTEEEVANIFTVDF